VRAVPGRVTFGFKTSPRHVSFATLDETWAAAAQLPVFVAAWMNDRFSGPAALLAAAPEIAEPAAAELG
jgi:hypothetical protein